MFASMTLAVLVSASAPVIPVDISGPTVGAASCVVVAPSAEAPGGWSARPLTDGRWSCGKNELLQCNAEGFEPLDTPATACAAGRVSVRMRRGAPVRLTLQGSATLEWRAVGVRSTQLLATRALPASSDVLIAEPRVLRVHRPGRAPISLVARPGAKLVIPAGVEGGELFGRVLGDAIRPERVHFKGMTQASAEVTADGFYVSPAMMPGTYVIEAEYRGGIRSDAVTENVVAGRTTERFGVGTPDAGGLTVTAEPDLCAAGNTLVVTKSTPTDSGAKLDYFVERRLAGGDCDIAADGLSPGTYVTTITGPTRILPHFNVLTTEHSTVVSSRRTSVSLRRPSTILTGTVYGGGRPITDMRLSLRRIGDPDGAEFWATTDQRGHYSIAVPVPGQYEMKHRVAELVKGAVTVVTLSPGETRYDWKLPAAELTISFVATGRMPLPPKVNLTVDGPQGFYIKGTFNLESEGHSFTFPGLPMGSYGGRAFAEDIISPDPVKVELTESNPTARLTVRLEPVSPLTVRVLRPDGSVLNTARISDWPSPQPGVFDLRLLGPGGIIFVSAPGYVPRCIELQRSHRPSFDVTMMPASSAQATFRFNPPLGDEAAPGRVFGLPGSDCPVLLSVFREVGRRKEGNATVVTIGGLPLGTYEYSPTSRYPPQPLYVPGPELGFMIRPRPQQ
jgi:hypothetical protein